VINLKYPKINTLWKRDENNKFVILPGDYSKEEFKAISQWRVTEKIDGTNIRVIWDMATEDNIVFKGRTDKAQIPVFLLDSLKETFTKELFEKHFPESQVVLYGEGYGNKIQSVGKKYRKDNGFILFDAWIDGWWIEQHNVKDIAKKLGIKDVPDLGIMSTEDIIDLVKSKPKSKESSEELISEGVVVRSEPLMLFRDGTPIMWKLKVKDYVKLEQTKG
jgi:ATP-dependent RNA circularization protein (DNA/RNA ligase family)